MELYYEPFKDGLLILDPEDEDNNSASIANAESWLSSYSFDERSALDEKLDSVFTQYAEKHSYRREYCRYGPLFSTWHWWRSDTTPQTCDIDIFINRLLPDEYGPMESFLGDLSYSRERAICIVLALLLIHAHNEYNFIGVKNATTALLNTSIPVRSKSRKEDDIIDKHTRIEKHARNLLALGTPRHNIASKIAERFNMSDRWSRDLLRKFKI